MLTRLSLLVALAAGAGVTSIIAQVSSAVPRGLVGKLFVAEVKGESHVITGERVFETQQASAFDAPGTVIETKPDSHNAFVYSNGSGLYVGEETRVEINRFEQGPFAPPRQQTEIEPSVSVSNVYVAHGFVGLCTSRLVSGSSMTYATPHATVNIRGRRLAIETSPTETTIYLLEGDVTVRADGARDPAGQVLRAGEMAIIQPGRIGAPPSVTIGEIPRDRLSLLDDRVNVACNARRTVAFDVAAAGGSANPGAGDTGAAFDSGSEIIARPAVPTQIPAGITVSPDRLPGPG